MNQFLYLFYQSKTDRNLLKVKMHAYFNKSSKNMKSSKCDSEENAGVSNNQNYYQKTYYSKNIKNDPLIWWLWKLWKRLWMLEIFWISKTYNKKVLEKHKFCKICFDTKTMSDFLNNLHAEYDVLISRFFNYTKTGHRKAGLFIWRPQIPIGPRIFMPYNGNIYKAKINIYLILSK